jgi:cobalt-zinc-cadmium efflux system outer membrane protein
MLHDTDASSPRNVRPLRRRPLVAVLFGVACAALAEDREASAQARWTLEAVVSRAVERAPDVQRAQARIAVAEAHHVFGRQPRVANPVVAVRTMLGIPDDRAATYGVVLGMPIDLSGRQTLRSREAEALVEASDAALAAARNDARAAARDAFIEIIAADGLVALREGRARLATELLARTRALADAGSATAVDLALVESELGEARAASFDADRAARDGRTRLRGLLDLDADDPVEVAPLDVPGPPEGELARWRARAVATRAEPRTFAALRRRLGVTEDRLYAEAIDPIVVALEWESQGNVQTANTIGASVSTTLPFLRTSQGERAVTRGERDAAAVDERLAARAVEREVVRAAQRLTATLGELQALETDAIPAIERAREGMLTQLQSGAADVFRVLAAQRRLFEAYERRLVVFREAWRARVELDRAIGVDS